MSEFFARSELIGVGMHMGVNEAYTLDRNHTRIQRGDTVTFYMVDVRNRDIGVPLEGCTVEKILVDGRVSISHQSFLKSNGSFGGSRTVSSKHLVKTS
jgi:hypothetical protein